MSGFDDSAEAAPAEICAPNVPSIRVEPVPFCPVCGGHQFTSCAVGFDFEYLTCRNPWRLVECAACRHVWLNPRPALETLATIYPPNYYAYNYDRKINPIARRGKEWLDRAKLNGIIRALKTAPTTYLDIGCGNGRFLDQMRRRGLPLDHIFGLELDERVVGQLADAGYRAFARRVEDCSEIPDGSLDLATMFHVIEHVDDPKTVVRRIRDWLRPGGVLALETPNLDSFDAHWFRGRYWGGYHIPRHWNLFSPATLHRLLADAGFEVLSTRFQTGHAFWMWSFHHRLRYGKRPHPRLARWFDPHTGLPFLILFTAFDKLRIALGFRSSAMLALARRPE